MVIIPQKWRVKGFREYSFALTVLGIVATISITFEFVVRSLWMCVRRFMMCIRSLRTNNRSLRTKIAKVRVSQVDNLRIVDELTCWRVIWLVVVPLLWLVHEYGYKSLTIAYTKVCGQPIWIIFHGVKYTLRAVGYTFHGVQHTFHAVQHTSIRL